MSLPLFKLGALLVKQLSKPVAKLIKEKATSHEKVRTLIVMPIGQSNSFKIIFFYKIWIFNKFLDLFYFVQSISQIWFKCKDEADGFR